MILRDEHDHITHETPGYSHADLPAFTKGCSACEARPCPHCGRSAEPAGLDVERLEAAIHASHFGGRHLSMTDAEADQWSASALAAEYARLGEPR